MSVPSARELQRLVETCRARPHAELVGYLDGIGAVDPALRCAIEAALVFMLTSAQVDDPTAWAVVVLFRLINYWFPTIPGYLALKVSERRQLV